MSKEYSKANSPNTLRKQDDLWGMGEFTDHMIIYGTISLVSVIYVNGLHFSVAMLGMAAIWFYPLTHKRCAEINGKILRMAKQLHNG